MEMNYLSVSEIAKLTGMRPQYINAEIRRGNLKAVKIGNSNAVLQSDFDTWRNRPKFGSRKKKE